MAAGKATLDAWTPDVISRLNAEGERVRGALRRALDGLPFQVTGAGSLFKICATPRPILNQRTSEEADAEWEEIASLALLNEGFLLTTRLHGCLSTATTADDVEGFVAAVTQIVRG